MGTSDTETIGIYIYYNLAYAAAAFPFGILADRVGLKNVLITGLLLFTMVYAGMTRTGSGYWHGLLFFLYGLYAAATEGISKAWISNISSKKDTATAIGTYTGLQSICALLASTLSVWLWFQFSAVTAFRATAIMSFLVAVYLLRIVPTPKIETQKMDIEPHCIVIGQSEYIDFILTAAQTTKHFLIVFSLPDTLLK